MGKVVKVEKDDVTLFDGYGYLVKYKIAKDIFSKFDEEINTCIMCRTLLAYYLTHALCHEVISSEKIDSIQLYLIEHPEVPYYRWEGCTFSA